MRTPYPYVRPGTVARHSVAILLALVALTGCDSGTNPEQEAQGIEGTWIIAAGSQEHLYLEITDRSATFAFSSNSGDCWDYQVFELEGDGEDQYTLVYGNGEYGLAVAISRDGDVLTLTGEWSDTTETFGPATTTISDLPRCESWPQGGRDPSIDCSELPRSTLVQTNNGTLDATDRSFEAHFYDLWGVTVTTQKAVYLDVGSVEFDARLYLYKADGTFVARNRDADHADPNSTSKISRILPPGCYRIEVTSAGVEETGSYYLAVN